MTPQEDAVGCNNLEQAYKDGNVKIYPKEQTPHPGVSFFVEIRSSLGKDPCSYLGYKKMQCIPLAKNVVDPDDSISWDFYMMNCPTGPPCHFLQELLSEYAEKLLSAHNVLSKTRNRH